MTFAPSQVPRPRAANADPVQVYLIATTSIVQEGKPTADHKKGKAKAGGDGKEPKTVEVDLHEFSVTVYEPTSNSTIRIHFHLFGIVDKEKKKEFDHLFELNQVRFRELVMRQRFAAAAMADLSDPSLGVIKRTILDKANKILGQPLLQELVISDYTSHKI